MKAKNPFDGLPIYTAGNVIGYRENVDEVFKMSCKCMNADGTPSLLCHGTCQQKRVQVRQPALESGDASLADVVEYRLGMFLDQLDNRMDRMEKMCRDKFLEGVRFGVDLARDEF